MLNLSKINYFKAATNCAHETGKNYQIFLFSTKEGHSKRFSSRYVRLKNFSIFMHQ